MIGMLLKDIATRENTFIQGSASLRRLIELMNANDKGVVVVVEDSKPVGIVTERDIVDILYRETDLSEEAGAHAKKQLIMTTGDRTIGYALNLILENGIRRIIVTDKAGDFIGVLTQKDMIRHLEEDFYRGALKARHILEKLRPLISVAAGDPLKRALKMIVENKISAVPVLRAGAVAGIISEKDILKLAGDRVSLDKEAGAYMTEPVVSVSSDTLLVDIVRIMNSRNIRRVIIEDGGRAAGIITDRDMLRNLEGDYTSFIERKLRHSKDVMNLLPEILLEIVDTGTDQFIMWANEKAVGRFGSEIIDKPVTVIIPPDKWNKICGTLVKVNRIEGVRLKRDEEMYELSGFYLATYSRSEMGRIQLIMRDITEDVRLYTTDPLTNLYNRRFLNEFIMKELERSKRTKRRFSIVIADLDDFKKINDTCGHSAGDAVLKATALTMSRGLRKADVIGRYGGEEFVVIMPETPKELAVPVLDRLRECIAAESIALPSGQDVSITASFGVAVYPEDGSSQVDLLIAADDRLYKAKKEGKNRIAAD